CLAADEPFDLRRVEVPARDLVPLLEPMDSLGLLRPESIGVGQRAIVKRAVTIERADARLLRERRRDADDAFSVIVAHGAASFLGSCTLAGYKPVGTPASRKRSGANARRSG